MDMQRFEGPLRCIPPEARRAVFGIPAGCYSVGKSHPITECWREINTTFPSGLCPLTILFPCQPQNLVSLSFSFTWHLDEQYTGGTKISLLEFNHTDNL